MPARHPGGGLEACANVIDHGAPADYRVSVSIEQACCVIRITHNGRHHTTIAPPPLLQILSQVGVFPMHSLMDEVAIDVEPDGRTTVLLAKRLCLLPAAELRLAAATAGG